MQIDWRRDGFALLLLVLMIALLGSAMTGAYRVFGYALAAFLGLMAGLGFVRPRDPVTWVPPLLLVAVLLAAFTGMFANESATVQSAADTRLGFQRGTAFLVYGIWIPAFVTMGVTFAVLFDRLGSGDAAASRGERGRR